METDRKEQGRKLARQVAAMSKEEREAMAARLPLVSTCEGRALSPFNACLLALQFSAVTIVGGYRQWQAAGRQVRKGEHSLMIWIPCSKKADAGEESEVFFKLAPVFDVSQTDSAEMAIAA